MKWFDEVNFNQNWISSRYDFLQKSTRSDEMFFFNAQQLLLIISNEIYKLEAASKIKSLTSFGCDAKEA